LRTGPVARGKFDGALVPEGVGIEDERDFQFFDEVWMSFRSFLARLVQTEGLGTGDDADTVMVAGAFI